MTIEGGSNARKSRRQPALRWTLALIALGFVVLCGRARADAPVRGGWIVVPSGDSEPHLAEAVRRASALEAALHNEHANLLAAEEVRTRFAELDSTPPAVLEDAHVRQLRAHIAQATRLLALGRFRDAIVELADVSALGNGEQDWLRRASSEGHELFDVCVVIAGQMAQAGEPRAAERQMQECVRAIPTLRGAPSYHVPETRELYSRVVTQLQRGAPASLVIRSANRRSCLARINGMPVGRTPAAIELVPTEVRLQLECSDTPGRVHRVALRSGFNETTIDPDFDRRVRSDQPRLRLRYAAAGPMRQRRALDAAALASGTEADVVLIVEATHQVTVQRLDRGSSKLREIAWPSRAGDVGGLARVVREILAPPTPEPVPETTEADQSEASAVPLVHWNSSISWIVPGSIALGYSAALATSLFALTRRAEVRRSALSGVPFDIGTYRTGSKVGLIGGISGAALATGFEIVGMPRRRVIPWWAWAAGGLGAAALTAGLVLAPRPQCDQMVPLRTCTKVSEDPMLKSLLFIHSVPLLAVPLTYLLSEAFAIDASTDGSTTATLQLRGSF